MTNLDDRVSARPGGQAVGGDHKSIPAVLIVDDDEKLQALIADFLEPHGIKVVTAGRTA